MKSQRRARSPLRTATLVVGMLVMSSAAQAEPEAAPGEGRELFVARCTVCHSIDYIEMHARFGTRALWEAEVTKMRNAFKAPIADEEVQEILGYLERAYGPQAIDRKK